MPDEWTWIDEPDSRCANGTPTGFAVNVHPGASHLVVFLEGGGACDNADDCWVNPTAMNIAGGYGLRQLQGEPLLDHMLFQRSAGSNPFADASYVFVPYCTGDLHAGNAKATYQTIRERFLTYHYGAHNLDLDLQTLSGAFLPSSTCGSSVRARAASVPCSTRSSWRGHSGCAPTSSTIRAPVSGARAIPRAGTCGCRPDAAVLRRSAATVPLWPRHLPRHPLRVPLVQVDAFCRASTAPASKTS